ncbi:MAG: ATP-binding cassette domain-containing protein [Alphaproteobacteria bacterium]|nr:ATP-binding cassette domain-containing protein [Alphaproteobacteria bacterium]
MAPHLRVVRREDAAAKPQAQARAETPVLTVRGLAKAHAGRPVLRDASLDVAPGEVVVLGGPSGAGKTTLFRCIARLTEPDAGSVVLAGRQVTGARGRALRAARREIGLVFQQFNLIRRASALGNVLAGRIGFVPAWRVWLRRFPAADIALARGCLARVGLEAESGQRADTLSGGQQQRVAIARALAQETRLILADEPVASLDPDNAAAILELLRALAKERGIAVLCSLHQPTLAARFADRLLRLEQGRVLAAP